MDKNGLQPVLHDNYNWLKPKMRTKSFGLSRILNNLIHRAKARCN